MSFTVYLIRLPKSVWDLWPEERSLAELAQDALTLKCLIKKGIDLYRQRANYIQICECIQSLSMRRLHIEKDCSRLIFPGQEADSYILLIESLHNFVISEAFHTLHNSVSLKDDHKGNRGAEEQGSLHPILSNLDDSYFYQPGDHVAHHLNLLKQMRKLEKWNEELSVIFQKKYDFYHEAYQQNNAVVEIVTFN